MDDLFKVFIHFLHNNFDVTSALPDLSNSYQTKLWDLLKRKYYFSLAFESRNSLPAGTRF
ncbi:hypothetical protein D3C76_1813200 [compost metagenome]